MKANHIVSRLLEDDDEIIDPEAYVKGSTPSAELVQGTLRDELVERGWRKIGVRKEEQDFDGWLVSAGIMDPTHRATWENAGARVIPAPKESESLRMTIMRWFKAAAKRAGMNVTAANIESLQPAYARLDLHNLPDDFEDDEGDWRVAIRFDWEPVAKFWSKASTAQGYETKPYQQTSKPPAAPRPRVRSLLTPAQQDAADEQYRQQMRELEQRAKEDTSEWEKRVAHWQRTGGKIEEFPDELH